MDEQQLRQLKPELEQFLQRYAPLFRCDENQAHACRFVQGLLRGGERRNAENIAETMAGGPVRSLQAFIATGAWHDQEILAQMRQQVVAVLADDDAVINADETGFPKKGTKSVGVKRQYSGTLGRTDNCQIGVFLNYASVKGHTFLDRRLYLPEEWAEDRERRAATGVPADVIFRTKPALALAMLAQVVHEGTSFRWVGGDSVYGDSPVFVQGVRQLGKLYVLDTSADAYVWTAAPQVIPASQRPHRGRRCTRAKVVDKPQAVAAVVANLPARAWRRVLVAEGSKGPRLYEYAELPVWFSEAGLPGPPERLLVRRALGQEPEVKYHRSNAPADVPLEKVAQVRGVRWTIEEDIQCGKGECGLDEYETRGWVGWHHHTALAVLALAFLVLQKQRLGEKRTAAECARSPRSAAPPSRRSRVGHGGDPPVVGVAPRAQPTCRGQSSKAAPRRTAAAAP